FLDPATIVTFSTPPLQEAPWTITTFDASTGQFLRSITVAKIRFADVSQALRALVFGDEAGSIATYSGRGAPRPIRDAGLPKPIRMFALSPTDDRFALVSDSGLFWGRFADMRLQTIPVPVGKIEKLTFADG